MSDAMELHPLTGDGDRLVEDHVVFSSETGGEEPFFELSRLMALAVMGPGDRLVSKSQTAVGGPWAEEWDEVSGGAYDLLAAGQTMQGFVCAAAQASGGGVQYFVEAADATDGREMSTPSDRWAAPVDLGLPEQVSSFSSLAIGRDCCGLVCVFGVSADMSQPVWMISQNPPRIVEKQIEVTPPGSDEPITITVEEQEPPATPWGDWTALEGVESSGGLWVANNADDTLAVFTLIGQGGEVGVSWNRQGMDRSWSGWTTIDTPHCRPIKAVATSLDRLGALNLFLIDTQAQVSHLRQAPPNGDSWTAPMRPGLADGTIIELAAGLDGDGDVVLAAQDDNGTIHVNRQISAEMQQWSGWRRMYAAPSIAAPSMDYYSDGRAALFLRATLDESLTVLSQTAIDSDEWDANPTRLAASDVRHAAVVRDLTPPES